MNKAQKLLLDCYRLVEEFRSRLLANGAKTILIETRSGYHVLIQRETLKFNYIEDIWYVVNLAKKKLGYSVKWESLRIQI